MSKFKISLIGCKKEVNTENSSGTSLYVGPLFMVTLITSSNFICGAQFCTFIPFLFLHVYGVIDLFLNVQLILVQILPNKNSIINTNIFVIYFILVSNVNHIHGLIICCCFSLLFCKRAQFQFIIIKLQSFSIFYMSQRSCCSSFIKI